MTEHADTAAEHADTDGHPWRDETRSLLRGVNLIVLIAAIAAGIWGAVDSMTDAGGDRFAGSLFVAAPGVYAGWCMLEVAWKRLASVVTVLLRLVSACFFAPAFVAFPIGVVQAIAVAFPGVRESIAEAKAANGGSHYYWDEGVVQQLLLVPFGGYVVGMCVALGVALILTLPIISIRAPQIAAQGSHIEKVDGAKRLSATAFVFVGLGATTLGIVLWVFSDGDSILEVPQGIGRFVRALSYGYVDGEELAWLLGVGLVVGGVAFMAWGCVRVLFARSAAARR